MSGSAPNTRLRETLARLGGKISDREIAALVGVSITMVQRVRDKLRIPPSRPHKKQRGHEPTTAEIEATIAKQLENPPAWFINEQKHRSGRREPYTIPVLCCDRRRNGVPIPTGG